MMDSTWRQVKNLSPSHVFMCDVWCQCAVGNILHIDVLQRLSFYFSTILYIYLSLHLFILLCIPFCNKTVNILPPSQTLQILNSVTYTNLHTDNSITEGQRNITLITTDTGSLTSDTLTILINVARRNDGPAVDLGGGEDINLAITYIENGPSVPIGLSHLIKVMDEEGNNISSMTIELVSTNGELDDGDYIFLRTPMALPFLFDPRTVVTDKLINISLPGDSVLYMQAIQAVRYINTEHEPTLFVNESTTLSREVIIRITDTSTTTLPETNEVRVIVTIQPINDNAPKIIINSDPVCTEDCRDSDAVIRQRFRRHLKSVKKRVRNTTHGSSSRVATVRNTVHVRLLV